MATTGDNPVRTPLPDRTTTGSVPVLVGRDDSGRISISSTRENDTTEDTTADGSGYRTPMEETDIPFFSQPNNHDPSTTSLHLSPTQIRRVRTNTNRGMNDIAEDRSSAARPPFEPTTSQPLDRIQSTTSRRRRANTTTTVNDGEAKKGGACPSKVSIKDRIACYRWTFFTMTMATGGMANVLHSLEYSPTWIRGIGIFFCLLNIVLFLTNCICLSARFYLRPGSLRLSFIDEVEALFIPAFVVSIGIILLNICEYGVPRSGVWLLRVMEVLFWVYVGLSVAASAGLYLVLWSTLIFPVHMMTPTWVFPAYPLLLTAPLASNLLDSASRSGHQLSVDRAAMAFGAATTQGTGCLIAFMISAAFMYRLMTQKLPRDMQRPGVFISIGPFGFTAAGIAGLGSQVESILPNNYLGVPNAPSIIKMICLLVALWLWGLSMWFFLVSVGSLWKYVQSGHSMPFQMTWWSFVFPNTALVTATETLGSIFESKGIQLFGSVMTACLIVVWVIIFITMLNCLRTRKLLWPKDDA